MAEPEQTAQGNRLPPMCRTRAFSGLIRPILRGFFVIGGLGPGVISAGCSAGESGLVLGEPLPRLPGGGAGIGGTASAAGGELPGLGGDGVAHAEAGAGGAPLDPLEPPWVQEQCTPTLAFENRDTTSQGQLFTDAVPDPSQPVWAAAHAACRTLFRSAAEVKPVPKLWLIVEDSAGIAYTAGTTLHISTRYLKSVADAGGDLALEVTGILHFATSLVYQNNGSDLDSAPPHWLIVGIADYVRLESGYIDRDSRAPGGSYDASGSQPTAFFLDYLATRSPSVVYQLNQRLSPSSPAWTNDVFTDLLGSDIDTLWADYQATL
jgi:hypothetical protein